MYQKLLLWSLTFTLLSFSPLKGDDGHRLWLKYDQISDKDYLKDCRKRFQGVIVDGNSPTITVARQELIRGLSGLTGTDIPEVTFPDGRCIIVAGTFSGSTLIGQLYPECDSRVTGNEGYKIETLTLKGTKIIAVAAEKDIGVLYGVFHLLRLIQTETPLDNLSIKETPAIALRLLNHWDNLDRTVERGYAGFSIWNWHLLPDYISPIYKEYARANASIGINGVVLNNVNADSRILSGEYLVKVAALADVFRPYGIKVYLTARFSAPSEIGGMNTSDPLDPDVITWWETKVAEIYQLIPDFGGFLVKANSEGQPGPQNYGRTHADGANMLADALQLFNGVIMWRAFVYDNTVPDDRARQAYNEFTPLDGKFRNNVLVQVKNGPIDFQPREPFHPLFGAMPSTSLMPEFQITQEYLGCATHLVYLAPLYEECLRSDTYCKGEGSTVARIIDGTLTDKLLTGIAGVSNIGNEINWTGHLFGQANWFAFGRLAWNPYLRSEDIAREWIRMTISDEPDIVDGITKMMMASREAAVNYMTPLGLHHIMAAGHHWGPGPWVNKGRPDWTAVYYHRADSLGIGFDRTKSGSNAVSQYHTPLDEIYNDLDKCPENLLLWFHHVPWDYKMKSGRTLWNELCFRYNSGVETVTGFRRYWSSLEGRIDQEQYEHVSSLLAIQEKEAKWWRDACLLYFQSFSGRPMPEGMEKPAHTLEYYESLKFSFVPGIK